MFDIESFIEEEGVKYPEWPSDFVDGFENGFRAGFKKAIELINKQKNESSIERPAS